MVTTGCCGRACIIRGRAPVAQRTRARGFGPRGRGLESLRARHNHLGEPERESVRIRGGREVGHTSPAAHDDPVVDRMEQLRLGLGHVGRRPRLRQRPKPLHACNEGARLRIRSGRLRSEVQSLSPDRPTSALSNGSEEGLVYPARSTMADSSRRFRCVRVSPSRRLTGWSKACFTAPQSQASFTPRTSALFLGHCRCLWFRHRRQTSEGSIRE